MLTNLQYFPEGSTPVLELASAAFPALQSLKLCNVSVTRADLGSLSACTQLSSLQLGSCQLQQAGASSNLSPLSALHSLRQLSFVNTSNAGSSIAAGLTQLAGLCLSMGDEQLEAGYIGHREKDVTHVDQTSPCRSGTMTKSQIKNQHARKPGKNHPP
jgi:hypothetical protein